jgi:ferredoxin--NADP+ reductase
MYTILDKKQLAPRVYWLSVKAPRIAKKHKPGQFAILRVHDRGERVPITIAMADKQAGSIALIVQVAGATSAQMCALQVGQALHDVAGPLGRPTEIENLGHVAVIGGGVGTAVIYPQVCGLKAAGNKVSVIIGGRTKDLVILEDLLASVADCVYPCTDDGSYGYHGLVTGKLADLIRQANPPIKAVYAAGPVAMMKAVAAATRPKGIRTIVSLNPIMVDGTGMCGGCRVTVGGKTRFACVDGPEFDGHQVDFDELADRLGTYKPFELEALERAKHRCKLEGVLK